MQNSHKWCTEFARVQNFQFFWHRILTTLGSRVWESGAEAEITVELHLNLVTSCPFVDEKCTFLCILSLRNDDAISQLTTFHCDASIVCQEQWCTHILWLFLPATDPYDKNSSQYWSLPHFVHLPKALT